MTPRQAIREPKPFSCLKLAHLKRLFLTPLEILKAVFCSLIVLLLLPYVFTSVDFVEIRQGPGMLALGAAAFLAALGFMWGKKDGRRPVAALWLVVAAGTYFIWRGSVELARPDGVETFVLLDRLMVIMAVLVMLVVGWIASVNRTSRLVLLGGLAVFSVVNVGVAFYQIYGDPSFYLYDVGLPVHTQATGIFGHHNVFASSLNAAAVYALAFVLLGRSKFWQIVAGVFLVLLGAGVIFSESRGGLISLVVGVGVVYTLALWRLHSEKNKRTWVVALSGVIILTVLMLMLHFGGRFIAESRGKEMTSSQFRTELVHLGIDLAGKEPLLGSGARSFSYLSLMEWEGKGLSFLRSKPEFAHNEYVQMLVDYGFAGFLVVTAALLAALFTGIFRLLLRDEEQESDVLLDVVLVGALGGMAAFLTQSLFSFLAHIPSSLFFAAFHLGILLLWKPLKASQNGGIKGAWLSRFFASVTVLLCGAFLVFWGARYTEAAGVSRGAKEEGVAGVNGLWKTAELTRQPKYYLQGSQVLLEEAKKLGADESRLQRDLFTRALIGYREALRLNPYSEAATSAMAPQLRLLGEDAEAAQWADIAQKRFGVLEEFLQNNWAKSQALINQAAKIMVDDADQAERLLREAKTLHAMARRGITSEQLPFWKEENAYLKGWLACREASRLFEAGLEVWGKRQPEKALALMLSARKRYELGFRLLKTRRGARFQQQSEVLSERIAFLQGAQITPTEIIPQKELDDIALGEFSAKP